MKTNKKPARGRVGRALAGSGWTGSLLSLSFNFDFFDGFLTAGPVVLLLEFLDAAGGVDELHLAGEERMARRADFDRDILLGAARLKLVAAPAGDGALFVFGVNAFLHDVFSL